MSIDRWNRDDSPRLRRIEEKLDAVLERPGNSVVNNLSMADIDTAMAHKIDEACRPGGKLWRGG